MWGGPRPAQAPGLRLHQVRISDRLSTSNLRAMTVIVSAQIAQ
jgi:hypothetical protein